MRKGFTLVELLIVIVIMTVLAGLFTFSAKNTIQSSEANNVVSRLRNLKVAAMQMYVDKLDIWEGDSDSASNYFNKTNLKKYLNSDKGYDDCVIVKDKDASSKGDYAKMKWYVACNISDDKTLMKDKLLQRAKNDDLLGSSSELHDNDKYESESKLENFSKTQYKAVLLRVR